MAGVADMDRALRFSKATLGLGFPIAGGYGSWAESYTPPVALALDSDGPPPGHPGRCPRVGPPPAVPSSRERL